MNKKEIKAKVSELLSSGTAKAEVFAQLSGQGIKDYQLAYFIASYPNPIRCDQQSGKVNVLIAIMSIQAVLAFLGGYAIGTEIGPNAKWIISFLLAVIPLLFAWGFYRNRMGAYNGYIALSIIQLLPKVLEFFTLNPTIASVDIAISIGLIAYVWYVREKIFPGFLFMTPKKANGSYIFVE